MKSLYSMMATVCLLVSACDGDLRPLEEAVESNELQLNKKLTRLPEYYNEDLDFGIEGEDIRIAIAAEKIADVEKVMQAWAAISLKEYEILGM